MNDYTHFRPAIERIFEGAHVAWGESRTQEGCRSFFSFCLIDMEGQSLAMRQLDRLKELTKCTDFWFYTDLDSETYNIQFEFIVVMEEKYGQIR